MALPDWFPKLLADPNRFNGDIIPFGADASDQFGGLLASRDAPPVADPQLADDQTTLLGYPISQLQPQNYAPNFMPVRGLLTDNPGVDLAPSLHPNVPPILNSSLTFNPGGYQGQPDASQAQQDEPTTLLGYPLSQLLTQQTVMPTAMTGATQVNMSNVMPSASQLGSTSSNNSQRLGYISRSIEPGAGGGVATVSNGKNDPLGGVSYGTYQLSSKTGTMQDFLNSPEGARYNKYFVGAKPGTGDFSQKYKDVAVCDPQGFDDAQYAYIVRKNYAPLASYAAQLGFDTSNRKVQEALFSQGDNNGPNTRSIIDDAAKCLAPNAPASEQVIQLYNARSDFVEQSTKIPDSTKNSLLNRYRRELPRVLSVPD